jgi:hypothetical protein
MTPNLTFLHLAKGVWEFYLIYLILQKLYFLSSNLVLIASNVMN